MPTDVLVPNPFSTPILALRGDLNARDTYASVGAALTNWELCETMFGTLYAAFVKPVGGTLIILRAYGAILAAGSRHDMIAEAAESYFLYFPMASLQTRLKDLLKLYRSAAARRNEIAHGVVMGTGAPPLQYVLIPSLFASKKREINMIKEKYRLSTVELDTYGKCFSELGQRAARLMQDVRAAYEALPPKHKEQFA